MNQEAPIAFIHIPRTGGTSLRALLRWTYGESLSWQKIDGDFPADIAEQIPKTARVIAGHMSFGLHEHLPVRYATVLRDPVERCVSHYQLWRHQKTTKSGEVQPDISFQRFLGTKWAANLQARMVAGVFRRGMDMDDRRLLATAKRNLEGFEIVGFADALGQFAADMGADPHDLPRRHGFESPPELTRDQLDELRLLNAVDILVVQWARERFA